MRSSMHRRGFRSERARAVVPEVEGLEGRRVPATLTVTSLGDSGPGSLRAAIQQANGDPGPDTIVFAPSVAGTIDLASALPDLSDVAIQGPGASALTVERNGASASTLFRIVTVPAGVSASLSGLTIAGGPRSEPTAQTGGGIANGGTLTISACAIRDNAAPGDGGGVLNKGTLTIVDSALTGNVGAQGGGIANQGNLVIAGSTFAANTGIVQAGGIFNDTSGTLAISRSTLSGNLGQGGGGGAILSRGMATITDCTVRDNAGSTFGGGGISNVGTMLVANSTFSGNAAVQTGTPTTVSGGAIASFGTLTVVNSTFVGNSAGTDGGGIANFATATITACTFSGNTGAQGTGGIFSGPLPGVPMQPPVTLTLADTIVSAAAGATLRTTGGSFTSLGHNLFTDAPAVMLASTDLTNTDPKLGPLADNGGPTFTQALLPGSPALDAGAAILGVTTDQRGVARPQGIAPDIGAFEALSAVNLAVSPASGSNAVGQPFTITATVTDGAGRPLSGFVVTFAVTSGPNVGVPGMVDPASGRTDAAGHTSFTYIGAAGAGTDTVVATLGPSGGPATTPQSASVAWAAPPAPVVARVTRRGVHAQPTRIVLGFNAPMAAGPAQDVANYVLLAAGADGRFGTRDDRRIRIRSAAYDASLHTVTLRPSARWNLHHRLLLNVNGSTPGGLTSAAGVALDGRGNGQAGSDYRAILKGFGVRALGS